MVPQNRQFQDDPSIPNSERLWRRIPPLWLTFDENEQPPRWRPSSQAFNDSRDGSPMSVFLESTVIAEGRSAVNVLDEHPDYHLVSFFASLARSKNQSLVRDPLPKESAHVLVAGKKTSSVRDALAKASEWIVLNAAVIPKR